MLDRITTCKILEIRSQEQISFYTHTDTHTEVLFSVETMCDLKATKLFLLQINLQNYGI